MIDINPITHHKAGRLAEREERHLDAAYEYSTASIILIGWSIFFLTLALVIRIVGLLA